MTDGFKAALRRGRLYQHIMDQIAPWRLERLSEDERRRVALTVLREMRARGIDDGNRRSYDPD